MCNYALSWQLHGWVGSHLSVLFAKKKKILKKKEIIEQSEEETPQKKNKVETFFYAKGAMFGSHLAPYAGPLRPTTPKELNKKKTGTRNKKLKC